MSLTVSRQAIERVMERDTWEKIKDKPKTKTKRKNNYLKNSVALFKDQVSPESEVLLPTDLHHSLGVLLTESSTRHQLGLGTVLASC